MREMVDGFGVRGWTKALFEEECEGSCVHGRGEEVMERRHCDGGEGSGQATIVSPVFTVVLLWLSMLYCLRV
jgi:hypothetical protein